MGRAQRELSKNTGEKKMKGEPDRLLISGEMVSHSWSVPSVQLEQLLSLNIYYLLSVSQDVISRNLHSSPLRYELSLARMDPVRSRDLSQVPSSVSGRIGTHTWGC